MHRSDNSRVHRKTHRAYPPGLRRRNTNNAVVLLIVANDAEHGGAVRQAAGREKQNTRFQ